MNNRRRSPLAVIAERRLSFSKERLTPIKESKNEPIETNLGASSSRQDDITKPQTIQTIQTIQQTQTIQPTPLSTILQRGDLIARELRHLEATKSTKAGRRKENYYPVGRGKLNTTQLVRDSILTVRKAGHQSVFPKTRVSDALKDVIIEFLETHTLDITSLNSWDRGQLYSLLDKCGYYGKHTAQEFYVSRLEETLGEWKAGNHSEALPSEFYQLLDKCAKAKYISGSGKKIFDNLARSVFATES